MSANVLLVEAPGEFREGFVRAVQARGGSAQVRDDAMETLASLAELSPNVVLVAEDPGPPGAGSLCRILRRRFSQASVYRLGDPAARDVVEATSAVLPRSLGAELVARALLEPAAGVDAKALAPPVRAWEAAVGQLELGPLLIAISERWLSGRLVLTSASAEREIGFARGLPIWARSSVFGERLGALAVRCGLLDEAAAENASDLARASGLRLAEALLQLGVWQGHEALQALCVQLLEIMIDACNGPACQARFVADASITQKVPVLRLHPLTALLAASQRMPAAELAGMLDPLSESVLAAAGPVRSIDGWLADLGIDQPRALLGEAGTVRGLRERLVLACAAAGGGDAPAPDALALALLRAGALQMPPRSSAASAEPRLTPASLPPPGMTGALQRCARARFDAWPVTPQLPLQDERERAIDDYLHGPRPSALARALALHGPAAELRPAHASLLAQYVRLPVHDAQRFLAVGSDASAHQQLMAAHALRTQLDELDHDPADAFVRCKAAELRANVDRLCTQLARSVDPLPSALSSAAPSTPSLRPGKPSLAPPPARASLPPAAPPPARASLPPAAPPPARAALAPAAPPPPPPARALHSSLAAFPEAEQLVLHGKWPELRNLLAAQHRDPSQLPPALALVYAIALKEDARPDPQGSQAARKVDADALGIRAMSELLGVPEDSAAALVLAKRTLRRRPLEWNQQAPVRMSFLLVLVALAVGAGVGLLLNPTVVHLPWR